MFLPSFQRHVASNKNVKKTSDTIFLHNCSCPYTQRNLLSLECQLQSLKSNYSRKRNFQKFRLLNTDTTKKALLLRQTRCVPANNMCTFTCVTLQQYKMMHKEFLTTLPLLSLLPTCKHVFHFSCLESDQELVACSSREENQISHQEQLERICQTRPGIGRMGR